MGAINHDPLIHVMIYSSVYKLKLPSGKPISGLSCFDIHDIVSGKTGGEQAWHRALESMQLPDDGRDAQAAMLEIMAYGQHGAAFCGARGIPILEGAVAWSERHDAEARQQYLQKLGTRRLGRGPNGSRYRRRRPPGQAERQLPLPRPFRSSSPSGMPSSCISGNWRMKPCLPPSFAPWPSRGSRPSLAWSWSQPGG